MDRRAPRGNVRARHAVLSGWACRNHRKNKMNAKKRKVTIVGAGAVGSTFAYALAQSGLADEIAINDFYADLAKGQAMDLVQGQPFLPQVSIHAGDEKDYTDSDIVVVTAGAKQGPGETRLDLLKKNAGIIADIAVKVASSGCKGVMVIVSNPVDVLTKIALDATGWDRSRVIGSGTVLDTARFRYALARDAGVDARNVHGYILGEHGDSEFAAWSLTHVAGLSINDYCASCGKCADCGIHNREAIVKEVRESAYHIIGYKGSTYYAIGLAMTRIAGAILRNEHSILSVSVLLKGEFGIDGVALSVPCVVGRSGVERVLDATLPENEQTLLKTSARRLSEALKSLENF